MPYRLLTTGIVLYLVSAAAWVLSAGFVREGNQGELLNVACDPTRELWRDLNSRFQERYEQRTGRRPSIRQSHGGSSSQARSVIDGLDADVVSLAMFPDTDAIRKAGLIAENWEAKLPNRSLPYVSTIVFVVRKGNPKAIRDWADLARPGVEIITPSAKTSGNGKWSFLALWGSVTQRGGTDEEATEYVRTVYSQTPVLSASARAATMDFAQKRLGDVHLTWENEAHLEVQEAGGALEIVYPKRSILAEPHVAVVDKVVDRKGTRAAAEAYMEFLYTEEAQEIIAKHFHRPTHPAVAARTAAQFPAIELFTVDKVAKGWDDIQKRFFAEGAIFDRVTGGGKR
jgi:sulfate transport system substrate-binding protein